MLRDLEGSARGLICGTIRALAGTGLVTSVLVHDGQYMDKIRIRGIRRDALTYIACVISKADLGHVTWRCGCKESNSDSG